jgi:hypothetical protein
LWVDAQGMGDCFKVVLSQVCFARNISGKAAFGYAT